MRWRLRSTGSSSLLALAAVALSGFGPSVAAAHPPADASYQDHAVDSLICALEVDLAADSRMRFIPGRGTQPELLFPTISRRPSTSTPISMCL
jgi:hypothetical protein